MVEKRTLVIGGIAIVLIISVAVVGIALAIVFVFRDFAKKSEVAKSAGREFGKTTDQKGCMTEGLTRSRTMTKHDISRLVKNGDFVEGCLEGSQATEGFCENVPLFGDSSEGQWEYKQCRDSGMDSQTTGCKSIYEEHLMFCQRRTRSRP
ncbi:MAG: hypothetical protein WBO10_07695 [Pyrinomonadaceae bacterium]